MYVRKRSGPNTVPWGTPDKTYFSFKQHLLFLVTEERLDPFGCVTSNSVVL